MEAPLNNIQIQVFGMWKCPIKTGEGGVSVKLLEITFIIYITDIIYPIPSPLPKNGILAMLLKFLNFFSLKISWFFGRLDFIVTPPAVQYHWFNTIQIIQYNAIPATFLMQYIYPSDSFTQSGISIRE